MLWHTRCDRSATNNNNTCSEAGHAGTPIALQKRMNVVCADVYDLRTEDGGRLSWIRV